MIVSEMIVAFCAIVIFSFHVYLLKFWGAQQRHFYGAHEPLTTYPASHASPPLADEGSRPLASNRATARIWASCFGNVQAAGVSLLEVCHG